MRIGASGVGVVLPPYYRQVLEAAERYANDGENAVAVIVAQTACELVTEIAFESFFRLHGMSESDKKALRPRPYNLDNGKVRALYVLLSKDKIHRNKSFWPGFTKQAKLRHRIVHNGEPATAKDAKDSIQATTKLIEHVESVVAAASAT
jgi:hypothetical protein